MADREDAPVVTAAATVGSSDVSDARSSTRRSPRGSWLALLIVLAVLGAVVAVFHADFDIASRARALVVVVVALGLLAAAYREYFPPQLASEAVEVKYVIAFDAIAFVVIGLAAMSITTVHWGTGLLLAGACLLIGGFFGLLFGYPQKAAAEQGAQGQRDPTNPGNSRRDNLVAESAATLGKVLAGFTLAKVGTLTARYAHLCQVLGPAMGGPEATAPIQAGVVMAYFLATGFLAGLLLPAYFLSDRF